MSCVEDTAQIWRWLWLWRGLAAVAPIRPLAWQPPYAVGVALKKDKRQKNKTKQKLIWVTFG